MVITIFGLGFVGLTTSLGFAEFGHKVYGVEVNSERLKTIKSGKIPFFEPHMDKALEKHLNKNFFPVGGSDDELKTALNESEAVYYCVGTPYGEDGAADLKYLYAAIEQTIKNISDKKFRVLVTKSTVPPKTAVDFVLPHVEKFGGKIGENFGVGSNPEFLREGHCWDDFINADRIVLGVSDEKSEKILRKIYEPANLPVFCVSLNTAEFIKYLSNTLLATMISFSNEMASVAENIGDIDIKKAFDILHMDKRWNNCNMTTYVYPGCGYGGYCLPKDTNAFFACSKKNGFPAEILHQVIEINDRMPNIIADRIAKKINYDKNLKLGILGLSFKPNSDDVRDSSAAKVIHQLKNLGYEKILAYDPQAIEEFKSHYDFDIFYCDSYEKILESADVFIILTAWDEFSDLNERTNKKIIDCRYKLKAQ